MRSDSDHHQLTHTLRPMDLSHIMQETLLVNSGPWDECLSRTDLAVRSERAVSMEKWRNVELAA